MYYNRNYKTWEQAFNEVNAEIHKRNIINAIASEIAGKPVEDMSEFTREDVQLVWNNYYNTITLCEN